MDGLTKGIFFESFPNILRCEFWYIYREKIHSYRSKVIWDREVDPHLRVSEHQSTTLFHLEEISMVPRNLVNAFIALTAFVLFSSAGELISPRLAYAGSFEYCDTSMKLCPSNYVTCIGCASSAQRGQCQYYDYGVGCTRVPKSCWSLIGSCSCNTDAC